MSAYKKQEVLSLFTHSLESFLVKLSQAFASLLLMQFCIFSSQFALRDKTAKAKNKMDFFINFLERDKPPLGERGSLQKGGFLLDKWNNTSLV